VASVAGPASARWSVHDAGNTATNTTPPPGLADDEVCDEQVRGLTGWAQPIEQGQDPTTVPLPPSAFTAVTYRIYKAPPGSSLRIDTLDGEHYFVGYVDGAGVFQPAELVRTFTTAPRSRPPAPIQLESGLVVFTTAPFSEPISSVQPGDRIGLTPAALLPNQTVLGLTAVDCGDSGFLSEWEADPDLCGLANSRAVTGDVNGDGRADVVCQQPRTGRLEVGLARPGGQFAQTDWQGTLGFCRQRSRLLSGDVNGDGRADLVCHTPTTGKIAVARARTGGRFTAVDWQGNPGLCRATGTRLLLGDVTGDFRADLVCQTRATGAVAVARARTGGRFPAVDTRDRPRLCTATGTRLLLGDVTGDFRADLVCQTQATGAVAVARARTGGRFPAVDTRNTPRFCRAAETQVRLGDVNGNGRADLLCHDTGAGRVWLALARSGGRFPATDWRRNIGFCPGTPGWLQVADVSGDGRTDMLCHDAAKTHVRVAYSDL
jgi:hypothetical protein